MLVLLSFYIYFIETVFFCFDFIRIEFYYPSFCYFVAVLPKLLCLTEFFFSFSFPDVAVFLSSNSKISNFDWFFF